VGLVELPTQVRWIVRHRHWVGRQQGPQRLLALEEICGEQVYSASDYSREGFPATLGLPGHLLITVFVETDLESVVHHVYSLTHVYKVL